MCAARAVNAREEAHGAELLSVRVGTQDFALDIMAVREIRGWVPSTPLPHAPSYIKGMINLRGTVMAIVDLADRLGLPTAEPGAGSVVVVVELEGRTVGLLVDAVSDIITITDDMMQLTPETGSSASQSFVTGLVTIDSRIVSIISIAASMPTTPETGRLAAA